MKAAVITSFDRPPRYNDFADPIAEGPGEMLVDVLAVGLHHLTRARASGTHYSSTVALPAVPGADGVGRGPDGLLRYFVVDGAKSGTMAERAVIALDRSIVLPPDADPVTIAAAMNPAMGAWLALRCRFPFTAGQKVLILGATGSSGRMAVQIARHLGAGRIIAAGRNTQQLAALPALGATDVVTLDDAQLGALAHDIDVVLDFVWGDTAARLTESLVVQRSDRTRPLTWIQVGSIGGATAAIPAAALRASRLQFIGSGIGSVPGREIVAELPSLARAIMQGTLRIDAKVMPLRDVETAWSDVGTSERIVLRP